MLPEGSDTSFTRELNDFACRLASFSFLASQSRNTTERSPHAAGMPCISAPGQASNATTKRQAHEFIPSEARLSRSVGPTRAENPRVWRDAQQTLRRTKTPSEIAIAPLVLLKPLGFNHIVEVTLSVPDAEQGARAQSRDFMSVVVSLLSKSGAFHVASSCKTAARWRTYLNEGPQDKMALAVGTWLASAAFQKALPVSRDDAGRLATICTVHKRCERASLTLRILRTDGESQRRSHIRNWSSSIGSTK